METVNDNRKRPTAARKPSSMFSVSAHNSDEWKPLTGMLLVWAQIIALTKKNLRIRSRAWKTNLLLVAQAAIFIILTWGVDKAVRASNQRRPAFSFEPTATSKPVTPIPDCAGNRFMRQDAPCYTLLYAPQASFPSFQGRKNSISRTNNTIHIMQGQPIVDDLIQSVASSNFPPIPSSHIRSFSSGSLIDEYLLEHPNTAIAAVEFSIDDANNVGFSVQTNSSVQWFKGRFQDPNLYASLPVQVAIERELVNTFRKQRGEDLTASWQVNITQFAHPSAKSPSAIAKFAPTFLFASIMFQFVLQLHDILHEKESGVKRLMKVMGLRDTAFWVSWIVFQNILAIIEACLLVGFSYAFRFEMFVKNDFILSFLLVLQVSIAMTSLGFFVCSFLRKTASAVPVGFLLFVIAWVFLIVIGFGFPYSPKYHQAAQIIFSAVPWTLFTKGIHDLSSTSEGRFGGLTWSNRASYCRINSPSIEEQRQIGAWLDNCVMSLSQIYITLGVQTIAYMLLAIYFDNVLPDETGTKRLPWYFLSPAYWFPSKRPKIKYARNAFKALEGNQRTTIDQDVLAEQNNIAARCEEYIERNGRPADGEDRTSNIALEMYGLRKVYPTSGIFKRKKAFVAVEGNWIGIKQGECFCLLGPNGAGKTTTIHCLTGVLPFTAGDAVAYGKSIATANGLDSIRSIMGVCPQFDTGLWELLTGKEHLLLFASIKGLRRSLRVQEASNLLESVKLTEAGEITVGAYSGGMKRRLSVALAFLGDPKIVYLDEPTTGLDPISRRHLWDLIDKAKQDRAVILTTHSMEEADILGDRISIMVRGRLRCIGTSLRLKSRFGSGYRVSVRIAGQATSNGEGEVEKRNLIKAIFTKRLGVSSVDESHDYVHFLTPYENEDKLPLMLEYLKSHAEELGIADVQLRLTPLEEVFLNVTRKAELEQAEVSTNIVLSPNNRPKLAIKMFFLQVEGRYELLVLTEENIAIKVPIGADFIKSPNGNFYHIQWIQDENGCLKLQDYRKDSLTAKYLPPGIAK